MAAAIATMRVYSEEPVVETLYDRGGQLQAGIEQVAARHGVADHFKLAGRECNLIYETRDADGQSSQPFRTLFLQELVNEGVLAPSFVVSYSHSVGDIDRTIEAVDRALAIYGRALADGVEAHLKGPSVKPVYRRFA
jgi:glutamate-1-semialdehyde 2,1-aminomutase